MRIDENIRTALNLLHRAGYEAFIVGGAVRSWLLNQEVHDYDITTSAYPEETEAVFKDYKIIETGLKHGTVTVHINHEPVEITTYRIEQGYSDHRHPDEVRFTRSLKEDCARRDFTINAMCWSEETGLVDFYGGYEDLQNHLIRTVNDPYERFEEDALRILRALRFMSVLGFDIEETTEAAINEKKNELNYVSNERISEEFNRLLCARPSKVLKEFRSVIEVFLPCLSLYDEKAWNTITERIERCTDDYRTRLAYLLSRISEAEVSKVMKKLKYSGDDRKAVLNLLEVKDMPVSAKPGLKRVLNRLFVPFEDYLSFQSACDDSFDSDQVYALYCSIKENNECYDLKHLAISGSDLKSLGYEKSAIGEALNDCLSAVMDETVENKKDALTAFLASKH